MAISHPGPTSKHGWMSHSHAPCEWAPMPCIRSIPKAYAAITAAQTPGPGGYDYSLLSDAVDLIEPYDLGGNIDIIRSLNPKTVIVTTSFVGGEKQAHRIWRELIRGTRGLILWEDPDKKFLREDGSLDQRGREAAPYFDELRSGLGALIIGSSVAPGPVAILYSPASMHTQWILDWQPKGDAWSRNGTSSAYSDNGVNLFSSLAAHAGIEHQIISPAMIEKGVLRSGRWRVLILPNILAMSSGESSRHPRLRPRRDSRRRWHPPPPPTLQRDLPARGDNTGASGSSGRTFPFRCRDQPMFMTCAKNPNWGRFQHRSLAREVEPALFAISDSPIARTENLRLRKSSLRRCRAD